MAEQALDAAVILMIAGLGIYLTIRSAHHLVPYPEGPGEWRSAPRVLRPLLRSGSGPVAIGAVTVQAASATMFLVGLLTYTGVLVYPVSVVAAWVMGAAWALALISWGLVAVRARRWQRRAGNPDDHPV